MLSCMMNYGFCPRYEWRGLDFVTCKKLNHYMTDYEEDVNDDSSPDPAKHLDHYYAKGVVDGSYSFVLAFNHISYNRHMNNVRTYEEALRRHDLILEAMDKMAEKLEALIHEEVE